MWQINGLNSNGTQQFTHHRDMVDSEIIHNHNVTRTEGGSEPTSNKSMIYLTLFLLKRP